MSTTILLKNVIKVSFCMLFATAKSYGDQQALTVFQEAQQKTSALKGYIAQLPHTNIKTGHILTSTTTTKTLDSGVVLQRIETASVIPTDTSQPAKPSSI